MVMVMGVFVRMFVIMAVLMFMPMAVLVRVAAGEGMPACSIGSGLGFEGTLRLGHDQVHRAQHRSEHVVGLQLQVVGLQLQRDVAVAQVIGRAQQVEGRAVFGAMAHHHHRLRRCGHAHQRAVLHHQHVAAAHDTSTRQEHRELPPAGVSGLEAAFLPRVPVDFDAAGALEQHGGQAAALRDQLAGGDHGWASQ